jgi:beta-lactamase class A
LESDLRVRSRSSILRWVSSFLLIATVILLTFQLIVYSRSRANFPLGLVIADIPVGGVSRQEAAERLLEIYSLPVEINYQNDVIHLDPSVIDFDLNLESMIAAADLQRTGGSFWGGFWDYLWSNQSNPQQVPLDASYSQDALRVYLSDELSSRYDKASVPAQPIAGTTQFTGGSPGTTINTEAAINLIENAVYSSTQRQVNLPLRQAGIARPNLDNLQVQLQQIMDVAGYDGLADIYVLDLATNEELHFIYELGQLLDTEPDASFTAASLTKIPILLSIYSRADNGLSEHSLNLAQEMMVESYNEPADQLMEENIDATLAPLIITQEMRALGLENTFLAGQFYLGAPLLEDIRTPARDRTDIFTDPDPYNQTTPLDIGMLLADLYQCSETGGGAIAAVYDGKISQNECREMINIMSQLQIGVLLESGVPEGTRIAHKHGWATNPNTGVINTIADAGIVYTPSGDYVIAIFLYQPVQLVWEPISEMYSDLSEAIYNYFTLPGAGG